MNIFSSKVDLKILNSTIIN